MMLQRVEQTGYDIHCGFWSTIKYTEIAIEILPHILDA